MAWQWLRRKATGGEQAANKLRPDAAGTEPAAAPVIRHVPGIRVEVLVTLPDGGKARSTHSARLGSAALGRVRVGRRNLVLTYAQRADGTAAVFGESAAGDGKPAFSAEAPQGAACEWRVPLAEGIAMVLISSRSEDLPA